MRFQQRKDIGEHETLILTCIYIVIAGSELEFLD